MENSGVSDNTKGNGTNIKLEKSQPEDREKVSANPEEPKQPESLEPPFCGFDEAGKYFVAKIDVRYGHLAIFGFLQNQAVDFLKFHINRQMKEEQSKKIITPPTKKNWGGRFNIFK